MLTVNGSAALVPQDVGAYERVVEEAERLQVESHALRERLEELETLLALDEAYAELERGEGRPLEEALPVLRARLGLEAPPR